MKPDLPRFSTILKCLAAAAVIGVGVLRLEALTLNELLSNPKMTPKLFASLFRDFKFDLHPFDVQEPNQFLESETGDCIDYAVMADYVLKRRGYGTRLIRIEMEGMNMGHAVCYVSESHAYLDFNNRKYFFKLERSGSALRQIADEVADSFNANWTFAQQFTYDYKSDRKEAVYTVVKTDAPESDPDKAKPKT